MFKAITLEYEDYLRDESRKTGKAKAISFPEDEADLINDICQAQETGECITFQGARTGITAGAVPEEGYIVNFSRMNAIKALRYEPGEDCFYISVEPGLLLCDLRRALETKTFDTENWTEESKEALKLFNEKGEYFFPPDPTETTASLGGMAACNASGACSFYYGPVRRYVHSLRAVLSDGSVVKLTRGVERSKSGYFSITAENGRKITGNIPDYPMPQVKNASGYFCKPDMDLVDLFIGSEGTLGAISGLELKLLKLPDAMYGLMAFFPDEASAINFVKSVRETLGPGNVQSSAKLAAIEFFNHDALLLLERQRETNSAFSNLPVVNDSFHTGVYIEVHGNGDEADEALANASELLESCGGNAENTWIAMDRKEMERLKYFRHAVPEAVNLSIDHIKKEYPGVTKLGTDMSVPDDSLEAVLDMYNTDLRTEGLQSVIFGHIGNNHLHVNIIPHNEEEYRRGQALYRKWAERVVSMGGSVSAEHGIGKIKKSLLKTMYGEKAIQQMKNLKALFDPEFRFNSGNLF